MKKSLLLPIIILVLNVFTAAQSQTLTVDGVSYAVDTLENHQVGPGTQYISLRLTANNRLDVHFLKTDLRNPYIQIRTALGRDSIYSGEPVSQVAKRKSTDGAFYFAGTNGDFYNTTGYVGYPLGGSMVDSEMAKTPSTWNAFAIDELNNPEIGVISYNGGVKFNDNLWPINSFNHLRGENQLVLYNRHNGRYTRTNSYGTEVLIELSSGHTWGTNKAIKAKVLKIEKGVGNMAIPKGAAVLSGHGTAQTSLNMLQVNDEIEFKIGLAVNSNNTSNFTAMTGGDSYAMMLKNGVVEQVNIWNERHPRTALGYSQDQDMLIFCVVDGRGVSVGVTTKELAELMKSAGAYNAFNMDGGGSSTMYIAEYGKAVNRTSDGNERGVANSVFVVSTAPADNEVGIIKPYQASYLLPQLGEYIPKFYGYNQYGVLLDSDLQGVVLTCPPSLGRIDGNKFIATGDTPGQITATYNGNILATINIDFLPVSGIKIRLDSVLMDNRRDYPIEVVATTSAGDALISPAAFTWEIENPEICQVTNGVVKVLKNGSTVITGKMNDITAQTIINVEIPPAAVIVGDSLNLNDWTMTSTAFLKAQWNTENLPAGWQTGSVVNFVHAAGRAPFIKLTNQKSFYGLPDTVKLTMNVGNIDITRAILTFKNNLTQTKNIEFTTMPKNQDFSLDVPVDELFDTNDFAIYPVSFDNINYYLDAANMTPGTAYSLAVKEIALVYKDYVITNVVSEKMNFFDVYPNPVDGDRKLRIQLLESDFEKDMHVRLYELSGKQIRTEKLQNLQNNYFTFSMAGVESGTYLMQINSGNRSQSVKIIVK